MRPRFDAHSRDALRELAGESAHSEKTRRRRSSAETVTCPFCGESEEIYVDPGGGEHQVYTEDCPLCCRPRVVHVEPGSVEGELSVWLERGE